MTYDNRKAASEGALKRQNELQQKLSDATDLVEEIGKMPYSDAKVKQEARQAVELLNKLYLSFGAAFREEYPEFKPKRY